VERGAPQDFSRATPFERRHQNMNPKDVFLEIWQSPSGLTVYLMEDKSGVRIAGPNLTCYAKTGQAGCIKKYRLTKMDKERIVRMLS
jgi:hypothetical protein